MKHFSLFLFLILISFTGISLAQSKKVSQKASQKAMVVTHGALVYVNPDFDSELLTELKAGGVYDISLKTKGPFYKIRVRPKVAGWIADTDVKIGNFKGNAALTKGSSRAKSEKQASKKSPNTPPKNAGKKADKEADGDSDSANEKERTSFLERRKKRPFDETRFRGPTVVTVNYTEDTMGAQRTQNMPFFGLKVEGPNTLFSGDLRTSGEILFSPSAPNFYEKATGSKAGGWIFVTDFIFETALPQSSSHMLTFGFGPMFKYTHYEVTLQEEGKPLSYSLDDMTLGAVFDGGLGFRVGSYALRFNVKYYWEKTRYWGGSFTFGFPF